MNLEYEIFKKSKVNFDKLIKYGFKKEQDYYILSKLIMNDKFKAEIIIDKLGIISGKIYDLASEEEYTLYKNTRYEGSFVSRVRDEYKSILEDIKNNCFLEELFIYPQTNRIIKLIKQEFGDDPLFLWEDTNAGVFKNKDTNKWYGIIMETDKSKLMNSSGKIEVLNVKLDPEKIIDLLNKNGFYKAYHMNKKYWISITLDDTISDEEIFKLIHESYLYTIKGGKK